MPHAAPGNRLRLARRIGNPGLTEVPLPTFWGTIWHWAGQEAVADLSLPTCCSTWLRGPHVLREAGRRPKAAAVASDMKAASHPAASSQYGRQAWAVSTGSDAAWSDGLRRCSTKTCSATGAAWIAGHAFRCWEGGNASVCLRVLRDEGGGRHPGLAHQALHARWAATARYPVGWRAARTPLRHCRAGKGK